MVLSDWSMEIVPVVVIVPPLIGPVVAIEVTPPPPPPPPVVRVAVLPLTLSVPFVTSRCPKNPISGPQSNKSITPAGSVR